MTESIVQNKTPPAPDAAEQDKAKTVVPPQKSETPKAEGPEKA
jgi:hypothetical protein